MSTDDPEQKAPLIEPGSGAAPIDLDLFYQLIMMDEKTLKAWKRSQSDRDVPGNTQQQKLSQERNDILTEKTRVKKAKK